MTELFYSKNVNWLFIPLFDLIKNKHKIFSEKNEKRRSMLKDLSLPGDAAHAHEYSQESVPRDFACTC